MEKTKQKVQIGALNIQPRNIWGWYVVVGMIEGYRIEVRFDHRPSYFMARQGLLDKAKRLQIM